MLTVALPTHKRRCSIGWCIRHTQNSANIRAPPKTTYVKVDPSRCDVLCPYLPPLPWDGTGNHRIVFSLYCQPRQYQFESSPPSSFLERSFDMTNFLSQFQELTLYSYAFFQTSWDSSVTRTCLNSISMLEPVFAECLDEEPGRARRKSVKQTLQEK